MASSSPAAQINQLTVLQVSIAKFIQNELLRDFIQFEDLVRNSNYDLLDDLKKIRAKIYLSDTKVFSYSWDVFYRV